MSPNPASSRPLAPTLLAVASTVAYAIAVWFLSALWQTLTNDPEAVPRLATLFIKPLPVSMEFGMLHWQMLALASMGWCLRGLWRGGSQDSPLTLHLAWLFTALCLHVAGLLCGMVIVQYTLA